MPNNWFADRIDELIRAVDEIFIGKIPSEDDLYGIHQVLVERRDAEIAEPDADVAEAIDDITERIEWECTVHGTQARKEKLKMYDLELAALRQYQKPTDEAVRWAIDWQEAEKESAQNDWERAGAEWRMEPGAQAQHDERMAAFDLAIQALRQMRSEPCEWCAEKEDSLLVWTKEPVEIEWDDREYTTRGWTWKELKPSYCPNCGRKLVK